MNYEYFCPKKKYKDKKFSMAQIFFRNGDYFTLDKNEIIEVNVDFYDTLIAKDSGFCPVGKFGYIKFKLSDKKPLYDITLLYNMTEYKKDRNKAIKQLCLNEGGIYSVRLFNRNHWSDTIYGDILAYSEGENIVLCFQPNATYGTSNNDYHIVKAKNITKKAVHSITFIFENCESFDIYKDEIKQMQINCSNMLEWNSGCYSRSVSNGYFILKLDGSKDYRPAEIMDDRGTVEKPTVKHLEYRLCGETESLIEICRLIIRYEMPGYGKDCVESVEVDAIEEYLFNQKENDDYIDNYFVSGYAKRESDGTIRIVFGSLLPQLK